MPTNQDPWGPPGAETVEPAPWPTTPTPPAVDGDDTDYGDLDDDWQEGQDRYEASFRD